jgi:hypothetical protein
VLTQPADEMENPYNVGTKSIGVIKVFKITVCDFSRFNRCTATQDGTLNMFGEPPLPTWTNLAQDMPATVGSNQITLAEKVTNWRVGDTIVVACTSLPDWSRTCSESFNITVSGGFDSVGANSRKLCAQAIATDSAGRSVLTLSGKFVYAHNAEIMNGVDERAEVALVSRRIVVEGEAKSTALKGFGCHIMIINGFKKATIRGVEINRGGQTGVLGRYPIHFHLTGAVDGRGFVLDNSIHHSGQRCVTFHGVHKLVARRNGTAQKTDV